MWHHLHEPCWKILSFALHVAGSTPRGIWAAVRMTLPYWSWFFPRNRQNESISASSSPRIVGSHLELIGILGVGWVRWKCYDSRLRTDGPEDNSSLFWFFICTVNQGDAELGCCSHESRFHDRNRISTLLNPRILETLKALNEVRDM